MSGNSEPVADDNNSTAPPISNNRILWLTAVVLTAAVTVSLIYADGHFTRGLIIGGCLAFVNYFWLKSSLQSIFERIAETGEKPPLAALKYFFRYLAIGAVIAIVYLTNIASVVAVLLGLSAIAAAIMIEGFIRIISFISSSKREEI